MSANGRKQKFGKRLGWKAEIQVSEAVTFSCHSELKHVELSQGVFCNCSVSFPSNCSRTPGSLEFRTASIGTARSFTAFAVEFAGAGSAVT
jgi:hypothetical protein